MSRVLHVALGEGEVIERCLSAKVGISAIEPLPAGGTRLVCMSSDGAQRMRTRLRSNLIKGAVVRERYRPRSAPL
ncbi:MAG: hypothetical protein ACLGHC_06905 [Alphaproteobacteria bacterium]